MADENSDNPGDSEAKSGLLGDAIKKVFTVGVGAAFLTEETIRNYLSDLKLPKEFLNSLLQSALKSKEEMTNRVTKEVVGLVSKIDLVKEASRFLETHKFKVNAEIEILRKDDPTSKK